MAKDSNGIMFYRFVNEWSVMGMCVFLLKSGAGGSQPLLSLF